MDGPNAIETGAITVAESPLGRHGVASEPGGARPDPTGEATGARRPRTTAGAVEAVSWDAAREPISGAFPPYSIAAPIGARSPTSDPAACVGDSPVRAPSFGLSTTPVMDVKSELRLQLERVMLALVYREPR